MTKHRHNWVDADYRGSLVRVCRGCREAQRATSSGWLRGSQAFNPTEQKNVARRVLDQEARVA